LEGDLRAVPLAHRIFKLGARGLNLGVCRRFLKPNCLDALARLLASRRRDSSSARERRVDLRDLPLLKSLAPRRTLARALFSLARAVQRQPAVDHSAVSTSQSRL
jgi:hypothetical protein